MPFHDPVATNLRVSSISSFCLPEIKSSILKKARQKGSGTIMDDSDEQLQANTYIWSQSADQITISFLVPETCKAKDLDIVIEHQYVRAGLKGQEPVLKVPASIALLAALVSLIHCSQTLGKAICSRQPL